MFEESPKNASYLEIDCNCSYCGEVYSRVDVITEDTTYKGSEYCDVCRLNPYINEKF